MSASSGGLEVEVGPLHLVVDSSEVDALPIGDLSDWFNPFLRGFMRETLRTNGEVWLSTPNGRVDGIFLYGPADRAGSIFTRSRSLAETFLGLRRNLGIFSELDLGPGGEIFHLYAADLRRWSPGHRFRFPIRIAGSADLPAVAALVREVYGRSDEGWFRTLPSGTDRCFVAEVRDRIVGVGWASTAADQGRLHTLAVHPRYRRLGIGTDLAFARLLWLRAAGSARALSEIADSNAPSRAIAERLGMVPVGRLFEYDRTEAVGLAGELRREALRSSGSGRPSNR
jgi:ribosomal-protein-alanine N-acetyltransferase